eukprot:CAMPEP_0184862356 /NCGR_PEP_ID=MMETSP0580-20130426/6831_1 /TAXON_ID=1118495 /ORGANISM="Dactyliosolen fragilissimus" /LENGTH=392 /DNA_ID=CAMNT_0027360189 /DNA_START=13 /DNA_END=1188 /DNA_ORIENTATION=-
MSRITEKSLQEHQPRISLLGYAASQTQQSNLKDFQSHTAEKEECHDEKDKAYEGNGHKTKKDSLKMFLAGPRGCGKTSLLMDLALGIASSCDEKTPCFICDSPNGSKNRNNDLGIYDCCSVAFITPRKKAIPIEADEKNSHVTRQVDGIESSFVLKCTPYNSEISGKSDPADSNNILSQMEILCKDENSKKKRKLNLPRKPHHHPSSHWDPNALSKIKIKYIETLSDLLLFMSSVQSYPRHLRPWGAIIIDDVDFYLKSSSQITNDSAPDSSGDKNLHNAGINDDSETEMQSDFIETSNIMNLMRIVSLASDTVDFLDEMNHVSYQNKDRIKKLSLIFCMSTDKHRLSKNTLDMINTQIPTIASVKNVSTTSPMPHADPSSTWEMSIKYNNW